MKSRQQYGVDDPLDRKKVDGARDGQRSHRIGEVVEYRELDRDGNPTGDWFALRKTKGGLVVDRPRPEAGVSLSGEERPMIASGNEFTDLVEALKNQTTAITSLVATLAPEVPDWVGTDYLSRHLGCTPQWVCRMAEKNEIPKDCIVNRTGKGRVWKFHRIQIDQWLADKGQG